MTDIRTHAAVMLTEQGRLDALALGKLIGRRLGAAAIWHSPVPRCRQTAESLAAGARESGGLARVEGPRGWIGPDSVGGDPTWLNDQIAARGHDAFLRSWFDGRYSPAKMMPLAEAAANQMERVLLQLESSPSSLVIDVTHDWNLMLLREHYLGLRHEDVGFPSYLDSVAVLRRDGITTAWSLGRSVRLGN